MPAWILELCVYEGSCADNLHFRTDVCCIYFGPSSLCLQKPNNLQRKHVAFECLSCVCLKRGAAWHSGIGPMIIFTWQSQCRSKGQSCQLWRASGVTKPKAWVKASWGGTYWRPNGSWQTWSWFCERSQEMQNWKKTKGCQWKHFLSMLQYLCHLMSHFRMSNLVICSLWGSDLYDVSPQWSLQADEQGANLRVCAALRCNCSSSHLKVIMTVGDLDCNE